MEFQLLVRKLWNNQLIRYLAVGGINTIFGYSMYSLFTFIGLHYALVVLLAQISGILFNFNTTGRIVFNNTKYGLLYRFASVYVIIYLLNVLLLRLFVQINFNMYLAGAILILPMAFLSFLLNKTFVFTNTSGQI
jgi:putative flippase GtrA